MGRAAFHMVPNKQQSIHCMKFYNIQGDHLHFEAFDGKIHTVINKFLHCKITQNYYFLLLPQSVHVSVDCKGASFHIKHGQNIVINVEKNVNQNNECFILKCKVC